MVVLRFIRVSKLHSFRIPLPVAVYKQPSHGKQIHSDYEVEDHDRNSGWQTSWSVSRLKGLGRDDVAGSIRDGADACDCNPFC